MPARPWPLLGRRRARIEALAADGVRVRRLGEVGGAAVSIAVGGRTVELTVERAREAYERGLPEALA